MSETTTVAHLAILRMWTSLKAIAPCRQNIALMKQQVRARGFYRLLWRLVVLGDDRSTPWPRPKPLAPKHNHARLLLILDLYFERKLY